jgi:hypothetical protein
MYEKAPLDSNQIIDATSVVVLMSREGLNNSKRKAYILTNISAGGQTIYLSYGQEVAAGAGIPLFVGGSDSRMANEEPTQLAILAVSSAAGGILSIHEELY